MIKLDGSHGEGGGSLVRIALALSTLTGKSFEVDNIRKGRPKPGLKNQHLYCVKALQKLCGAKTEDVYLGSESIKYYPGKIKGKTISVDMETAGSITLFLQALILPSLFADKKVRLNIKGGTDTKWSVPVDYCKSVFLPQLRRFGNIDLKLLNRGYYPKGSGIVDIKIDPNLKIEEVKGYDLSNRGDLVQIKGISHASVHLEGKRVAERQAKAAKSQLSNFNVPVQIQIEYINTLSIGSGITLFAIFSKDKDELDLLNPIILGGDCLGDKEKRAEIVGEEAAKNLINEIESDAVVDKHLADQILPFLALAGGKIKTSEVTKHAKTNIYVIEKFLQVRFEIHDNIVSISK